MLDSFVSFLAFYQWLPVRLFWAGMLIGMLACCLAPREIAVFFSTVFWRVIWGLVQIRVVTEQITWACIDVCFCRCGARCWRDTCVPLRHHEKFDIELALLTAYDRDVLSGRGAMWEGSNPFPRGVQGNLREW